MNRTHQNTIPRIVVMDSGFGGLLTLSLLAEMAPTGFHLVYFNALYDYGKGFNRLPTNEGRRALLDSALHAAAEAFQPDLILIACNTLSVIYNETAYAQDEIVPVSEIVSLGVRELASALHRHPHATALLFATPVTAGSRRHVEMLKEEAIRADRAILHPCPGLAGLIEQEIDSPDTTDAIDQFVEDALTGLDPAVPLLLSLNCTHYGYKRDHFVQAMARRGRTPIEVLDPADALAAAANPLRGRSTAPTQIDIYTRIHLTRSSLDGLGSYFDRVSPRTASALRSYRCIDDLFPWPDGFEQ